MIKKILFLSIILLQQFFSSTDTVFAAVTCTDVNVRLENQTPDKYPKVILTIPAVAGQNYTVRFGSSWEERFLRTDVPITPSDNFIKFEIEKINISKFLVNGTTYEGFGRGVFEYFYSPQPTPDGSFNIALILSGKEVCGFPYKFREFARCTNLKRVNEPAGRVYKPGGNVEFFGQFINFPSERILFRRITPRGQRVGTDFCVSTDGLGKFNGNVPIPGNANVGIWKIETYRATLPNCDTVGGTKAICPQIPFGVGVKSPEIIQNVYSEKEICSAISFTSPDRTKCEGCIKGEGLYKDRPGAWTALGCVPKDVNQFVLWLLSAAIGLGGGIAFLLMIFGAFQVILSGGDPEKLNNGKEVLTSAVAGLLMIIFSVVLLKIIGYDILRIPGINIY